MSSAEPLDETVWRPVVLAFLRDIKANPNDNTPRLILADWLEENGDAGAHALAASPHLAHLILLNLEGNPLSRTGIAALERAAEAHPRLWLHVGRRVRY